MFLKAIKRIRKTISFQLTLWYSAIFILSSLVLFVLTYFLLSSSMLANDRDMIQSKLSRYALLEELGGLPALLGEVRLEHLSNQHGGFVVRLSDPANQTIWLTVPKRWEKVSFEHLHGRTSRYGEDEWNLVQEDRDEDMLAIANRRLSNGYILQVGRGSEQRHALLERFQAVFAGIMIPVVLLGVTGGSFLAFRALAPIRDLLDAVRSVDTGKMDARVPSRNSGDELDELAMLFNSMLEKISLLIRGMRDALDNVAHDLRTPVARLRAGVETVLQSEADADTLREALMDCAEESERIMTMLDTLMDISEAETGTLSLHLEEINMAAIIEELAELYQYVAEEKGVILSIATSGNLAMLADKNRIRQVIANLLDNAIKYNSQGGGVSLEAMRRGEQVLVTVTDTGFGIPSQDLPHVFDRLYRGDKSRSQRGLGLGLSLVQAVTEAHQGYAEVASEPGRGTQVTVVLPVEPRASP